jgi:peptidoglycan/xylan/chitin deacetylase (PgdA/CDA1 family)
MMRGKHFYKLCLIIFGSVMYAFQFTLGTYAHTITEPNHEATQISQQIAVHEMEVFSQLLAGQRITMPLKYQLPARRTVYLTFDDGPSGMTEAILDILKKEGIHATFFVLGNQAEKYPHIIKRIIREGHSLGNHSYNHEYKEIYRDFQGFWSQIQQSEHILEKIVGFKPKLLRAPGGTYLNFDAFYFYYLEQAGYEIHDWNVDSRDSVKKGVLKKEIIDEIKKTKLRDQMNVLFHDAEGHQSTVAALPEIIRFYKKAGYQFAKLTPNIKPIQFPLVPTRWARSTNLDEHLNFVGKFGKYALAGSEWLKQKQYPLRELVKKMGAVMKWDDSRKIATVHLGLIHLEYDLQKKLLRRTFLGHPISEEMFKDVKNIEGTLYVSPQSVFNLLHEDLSDFMWGSHPSFRFFSKGNEFSTRI